MSEAVMEKVAPKKVSTKSPEIGLASFVTFKQGEDFIELFPQPRKSYRDADTGENIIVLGDIPLPPGVPAPEGLTALYGFRDHLDEIQAQYATARTKGHELIKVEIKYDVGSGLPDSVVTTGTISLDNLHQNRCLNLLRLKEDLCLVHVVGPYNELINKECKNSDRVPVFASNIYEAGKRPDLLCKVIRTNPLFEHINSVIYSVPDGSPRGRKICTIFETKSITDIRTRGDAPFKIQLPELS